MRMPTYFISHGGGPWPWMDDWRQAMHELELALQDMPRQLAEKPKAILMVSGHWEADDYAVMANPHPPMVYDYSGFPAHTYKVVYPAPGAPLLAQRVHGLLQAAGLPSHLDPERGFDHGTFAPMVVIYPEADVPVIQLALRHHMDPAEHIAVGRALAPLRDEGVLIIGSGLSYHNLGRFGPAARAPSEAFDAWLQTTLVGSAPAEREARLLQWSSAPSARASHPREDHLIPLMVALGAAADAPATCVYHQQNIFGGVTASSFRFG